MKPTKKQIIHEDLNKDDKLMYKDGDEVVQVIVLSFNVSTKTVRFKDDDGFEWDEEFENIPRVIIERVI